MQRALNAAAHAAFFDREAGLYDSYIRVQDGTHFHRAQLTQALMLLCGACPPSEQAALRTKLASSEHLLPVTLSHSIFRYEALLSDPAYLPQVLNEIEAVWGAMLQAGATTFWETELGWKDFCGGREFVSRLERASYLLSLQIRAIILIKKAFRLINGTLFFCRLIQTLFYLTKYPLQGVQQHADGNRCAHHLRYHKRQRCVKIRLFRPIRKTIPKGRDDIV